MRCDLCFYRVLFSCQRNPPVALTQETSIFPVIKHDDWCGEFLHKDSGRAIKLRQAMKDSIPKEETHVDEPNL